MAVADLSGIAGNPLTRSLAGLTGAGALLTDPTSALLHPAGSGLDVSQLDPFPDNQAEVAGAPDGDTNNALLNLVTPTANNAVLDFHAAIEDQGHQTGLPGTVHAVTDLGEAVGLGKIGQSNLLTDVVNTPGALLDGDTSTIASLPGDVTDIVGIAGHGVTGIGNDLAQGQGVLGIPATLASAVGDAGNGPLGLVNTLGTDLNGIIHDVGAGTGLSGVTDGVTGLTQDIGLGHLGESNLLTDVVQAPGNILAGNFSNIGNLPQDVGNIVTDAGNSVASLGHELGALGGDSGLLGQTLSDVTASNIPATGLLNAEAGNANGLIQTVADTAGLSQTGSGLIHADQVAGLQHLGDGHNLVTDAVATPGDLLQGNTDHASFLPSDAGNLVAAAGQTLSAGANDIASNTGGVLNGGENPLDGLLRVGGADTSGSDHNLVQVGAGDANPNGFEVGALNAADPGTAHAADVGVAGVQAGGPQVADLSLLSDGLNFGNGNPASADSLVGALQSHAAPQASASADGSAGSHGLVDVAAFDVANVDAIHQGSLDQITQAHHAGI